MAKSGTINGSQSGNRPYLRLRWDTRSQDIPNNRSRVRLRLYVVAPYRVSYSANKKGSLHGSGFTHTSGMSGTGEKLIRTQEVWVNHSSNGSKSVSFSAWYDINITFSGSYMGRISVSGTASLDTIPRASDLNSASLSQSLNIGRSNALRISKSKKSSSFYESLAIRDGSTNVHAWTREKNLSSSLTLTDEIQEKLLKRIPSGTSKTFSIRLSTWANSSTSTAIGRKSINLKMNVSGNEKPKISSTSASISGSGWDNKNGVYLQNFSRVSASFSNSPPAGARIAKEEISIQGDKKYSGRSITSGAINRSGTTTITYTTTDSRGRTASSTRNITFTSYAQPAISKFSVDRQSGSQSRAQITYQGTSSTVSNKNKVNIKVQRQLTGSSSWSTIDNRDDSGNFSRSIVDTGADATNSYMYRVVVTDTVGRSATREQSLSTARVLMDLNADKGVGIGKMHERGALDLAGDIYVSNDGVFSMDTNNGKFITFKPGGTVAFAVGADKRGDTTGAAFQVYHDGRMFHNETPIIPESGSNSNGQWVKFPDGTMICTLDELKLPSSSSSMFGGDWVFPQEFNKVPVVTTTLSTAFSTWDVEDDRDRVGFSGVNTSSVKKDVAPLRIRVTQDKSFKGSFAIVVNLIAIGRWK